MITPSTKAKRGITQFYLNGTLVYFWKITDKGQYHVCFDAQCTDVGEVVDFDQLESVQKFNKPISNKPKQSKIIKSDLNDFYLSLADYIPFNCQNCGKPLYAFNKVAQRACSCHLLPKSKFESIATNKNNIVFMGADYVGCPCDCHTIFDSCIEARIKMPVYKIAVRSFERFLIQHLTEPEIISACEYLNLDFKKYLK